MERIDAFVSAVAHLQNDAKVIESFVTELYSTLSSQYSNFEIVLVDNHSEDDTAVRVEELLSKYRCMRLIRLSRRVEIELAILAGLESAIGDWVVTMQPDRDPPEQLSKMLELARSGHDIVVGVTDKTSQMGACCRLFYRIYHRLIQKLILPQSISGVTAYRVFSRQAVNALTRVRQRYRFFPVIISEIGFPLATYPYEHRWKRSEKPRIGILESFQLGLKIITYSSKWPLRLVSVIGLLGSLLSMAYAGYVIVINLFKETVAPGWTTLSLQISGLFMLVFVMFALIGEYLARVLEETSERPLYYVREEKASAVMLFEPTRTNVLEQSVADPTGDHAGIGICRGE